MFKDDDIRYEVQYEEYKDVNHIQKMMHKDTIGIDTANKTAKEIVSQLSSEEFKNLSSDERIDVLQDSIEIMAYDMEKMTKVMMDITDNIGKLVDYIDSVEDYAKLLSAKINKVKTAERPIMITGGNRNAEEVHGVDKAQKTESIQASVHSKDGN